MEYWHALITEKSWEILQKLKGKFDFVLIGGWATYLWAKSQKSKDIDVIIDFTNLEKLKKEYLLRKNDNLKKYEIKIEEIDIDIYLPFYSKLTIPIEDIPKEEITKIEGFSVVSKEILLILKQGAEEDRALSEKGEKDRIDILSLVFFCDIDYKKYFRLLKKYQKENYYQKLINITKKFKGYQSFNMTPRQLKLKKKQVIEKIKES